MVVCKNCKILTVVSVNIHHSLQIGPNGHSPMSRVSKLALNARQIKDTCPIYSAIYQATKLWNGNENRDD